MALYDNPLWVLSHIRNSFVVSDDTGNCELVMGGDKFKDSLARIAESKAMTPFLHLDVTDGEDEEFAPRSLEIRAGSHPMGYRPRCNTEIKLEKMKRDRKSAPNVRTVSWRAPSSELTPEELDQLFPQKNTSSEKIRDVIVPPENNIRPRAKSLLSELLDQSPSVQANIFYNFSQISGETHDDGKNIRIYLAMCQKANDSLPYINIRVKSEAKVYDVIGYTCYAYTEQRRQPPLSPTVDLYSLYLYEDGEIELELPALEAHEPISRYGFNDLALVQQSEKNTSVHDIKVTLPDGTFTVVQLPSKNITLQELMDKAMAKRRKLGQVEKFRFAYNIERHDTPGIALDPMSLLSGITDTTEFYIVRQNSRRFADRDNPESNDSTDGMLYSVELSAYKEFPNIRMVTRLRTRIPVMLIIAEDKLEIIPAMHGFRSGSVGSHGGGGLSVAAASSLHQVLNVSVNQTRVIRMDSIVACSAVEKDESLLTIVHMVETGFSKLKLESSDPMVGREICARLKYLMSEHASSVAHAQYKIYLVRKSTRRRTLHF